VLQDSVEGVSVTQIYQAPGATDSYSNYLYLVTPGYIFLVVYDNGKAAQIQAQATGGGACGAPGGVIGQTFGAVANIDTNGLDFSVSSAWYLAPQYSLVCANAVTTSVVNHAILTK